MKLVLDTGALIAIDRRDHRVAQLIELARRADASLITSSASLAQSWRDGARQANLARSLSMLDLRDLTSVDAKQIGELLRTSGTSDVVDAHVILLAEARGLQATIVSV
jgi:hypothetical protein